MARSFNGSTDKIITGTITSALLPQNTATQFTMQVWVNPTTTASIQMAMYIATDIANGYDVGISTGSAANWRGSFKYTNGSDLDVLGGSVATNTWTHLLVTLSAGTTGKLYVNGTSVGTPTNGPQWGRAAATSNAVHFGEDVQDGFSNWGGSLADGAIWPGTLLTQSEITALANGARPFTIRPQGLSFFCPLDGLQSPEPDLSGNKNNGTVTGTALAAGPPVMMFTPRWPQNSLFVPTGAAFNPAWAMGSRLVDGGIGI